MPALDVSVSFPLAFVAGLVSFLSPCVLPVVPSYLAFISGVTVADLSGADMAGTRRRSAMHAVAFGVGFGLVFMTLGAAATAAGQAFARSLPMITRIGGVVVVLFGLHLMGMLRWVPGSGVLSRELRIQPTAKPAGLAGSVAVGVAFGAGWSPCIGPVLASIMLFASLEGTVLHGTLLLATYGVGLAVPFVGAALGFSWFLTRMEGIRRHLRVVEILAGTVLLVVGVMMVTGHFSLLNSSLAGMGQLINLETP